MNFTSRLFIASITIPLLFTGCSSGNDDPEPATQTFYGEFLDLVPVSHLSVETFSPQQAIDFILANDVPTETSSETVFVNIPEADQTTSAYTVQISGDKAYFRCDTEKGQHCMRTKYVVIYYRFTPGTYPIRSNESQFERFIEVSDRDVKITSYYEGLPTEHEPTILTLDSSAGYTSYSDKEEIEPCYIPHQDGKISHDETGNAILNSDGTYTLAFSSSTYTLYPSTGLLIQLSPEYLEIGNLDRTR